MQVDRTDKTKDGQQNLASLTGDSQVDKMRIKQAKTLIEGMPIRNTIDATLGADIYKIDIKQVEGFEKPIKISLSPIEGAF